jgi:hypothetical protein
MGKFYHIIYSNNYLASGSVNIKIHRDIEVIVVGDGV